MYLICQHWIYQVVEVNRSITEYLTLLTRKAKPQKLVPQENLPFSSIQDSFQEICDEIHTKKEEKEAQNSPDVAAEEEDPFEAAFAKSKEANSPDHNIDDLLSQFKI